jgi:phenylacetate-CoA ligase
MIPHLNQISSLPSPLRHPRATREEIIAFQNKQLRRLVTHAYQRVPYYNKLFRRVGVEPRDIRTVSDLSAIPITSRKDLQALPADEVVARSLDPNHLIDHTTSGSSGEPLTIRRTWLEERLLGLLRLRALHSFGLRLSDRRVQVVLARSTHARDVQLPLRILQSAGLYRVTKIDCLQAPEEIARRLRNIRPDVVTGFSGALARVAQTILSDDARDIHPRFVSVGGETLTASMRSHMTEAFRAPVFELYGSHEFNLLAWQCKETNEFHTCDDGMILEVIKDGGPAGVGEQGEVVGTGLHSFAMPFIRYRLGDLVIKGSTICACGQPFSTIRAIQGRMIDYFPLPGGRLLHPYQIVVLMQEEAPWIREYRLIQEREDRVILQLVPFAAPPASELSRLRESIAALLGKDVAFQVDLFSHIPLEANGKFRISRSLVSSVYERVDYSGN